jgi:hypothetical protein
MNVLIEKVESHARFPLLWAGLVGTASMENYRRANELLFKGVAKATGGRIIVDSSKYASRALALSRFFPGRVRVLCITRSPFGLITAFRKKNEDEQRPKSVFAVTAYYLYVLFCMWIVKTWLKRNCLSIRYEDLKRDPVAVIKRVEEWGGYPLDLARNKLVNGEWFEIGHIVTGNRMRKRGRIRFDSESREEGINGITERSVASLLERYRRLLGF